MFPDNILDLRWYSLRAAEEDLRSGKPSQAVLKYTADGKIDPLWETAPYGVSVNFIQNSVDIDVRKP